MTKPPVNRVQVQSYRVSNKPVTVDTTATNGAQFGVNIWDPSGNLVAWPLAPSSTSSSFSGTTDDVNEGQWNLYFTIPRAQDAVGAILQNSANITLTYVTHTSIKADLTTITPTSGGTLQATAFDSYGRINKTQAITWATAGTVAMAYASSTNTVSASLNTTAVTAGSYGSAAQSPTFTVNATGQLTAASNVTITPAWSSITGTPTTLAGYGITDAVKNTRQVIPGTGLSGGGALSADVTLALANIPSQTLMGNYSAVTGAPSTITIGANLNLSSGGVLSATGGGGGGVTSVGLSAPTQFNVTGSPVTGSGTLTFAWATQSAALVLAGPATGSAAAPTFRSLALTDLPSIATATLLGNPSTSSATPTTITIGSGLTLSTGGVLSASATTGTVTSVGLSAPTQFSVSGSPVTTTGTLTFSWSNQTANTFLAGPTSGSAATPTFRAVVNADIPSGLSLSGSLAVNTGASPSFPLDVSVSSSVGRIVFTTGTFSSTTYASINSINSANSAFEPLLFNTTGIAFQGSGGVNISSGNLNGSNASFTGTLGAGATSVTSLTTSTGNIISGGGTLQAGASSGNYTQLAYTGIFTTNRTLNPGTAATDLMVNTSGLFGGGYGLIDGSNNIGLWSNSGVLQIGFGTSNGALTAKTTIDPSGNIVASGAVTATTGTFSGVINANSGINTSASSISVGTATGSLIVGNTSIGSVAYSSDNTVSSGKSAARWTAVYAVNGTIQTSDALEKTPLLCLSDAEIRVANYLLGRIGTFQWLSDIESKVSKHHIGTIAQDICSAFESEGLDWRMYGMITHDDDRFGVNYAQLNQLLAASLHHRLMALEALLLTR